MLMINRSMPEVRTQIIGSGCFKCNNAHIFSGKKKHEITKNMLTMIPSQTTRPNHLAQLFIFLNLAFLSSELLKRLHIFHQRFLLFWRQTGTVKVTRIRVTRDGRVIEKISVSILFGNIRNKADILLVEDIVASVKFTRPICDGLKQGSNGWHRSIV